MPAGASRPAGLYESPAPWGQPPTFQPTPTAMSMDITLGADQTGPALRSQAGGSQEDTDGFRAFGYTGEANKWACPPPALACTRVTQLHALGIESLSLGARRLVGALLLGAMPVPCSGQLEQAGWSDCTRCYTAASGAIY